MEGGRKLNEKLSNGFWKLYFVQLSPKIGGDIVYKIGVTEYKDVLNRFISYEETFNVKVLCSLTFTSEIKAKSFENCLLSIYSRWPNNEILEQFKKLNGQGEVRYMNNFEKAELLNFMFMVKNNSKGKITL